MSNYKLACAAVSKSLNIDVKAEDNGFNDVPVFINGKKRGYINWRSYRVCSAKIAYYAMHSLCRESLRFYK